MHTPSPTWEMAVLLLTGPLQLTWAQEWAAWPCCLALGATVTTI